jgi:hypothetical protein
MPPRRGNRRSTPWFPIQKCQDLATTRSFNMMVIYSIQVDKMRRLHLWHSPTKKCQAFTYPKVRAKVRSVGKLLLLVVACCAGSEADQIALLKIEQASLLSSVSTCSYPLRIINKSFQPKFRRAFTPFSTFYSGFITARSLVPQVSAGMVVGTQALCISRTIRR